MSKYPVLKATMEELKKSLSFDFKLVFGYSGSNDEGWFEGFHFQHDKGNRHSEPVVVSKPSLTTFIKTKTLSIRNFTNSSSPASQAGRSGMGM